MSDKASGERQIDFRDVYYVKLGRNGIWEESSIAENKLRIGWERITLSDINRKDWNKVKTAIQQEYNYSKGADTRDLNALKAVVESTERDVWITFHDSRMWWCRVGNAEILEDKTSKYRELESPWSDRNKSGKPLMINDLPGQISKTRGFRATVCRVEEREAIHRLLNDQPSHAYTRIFSAKEDLVKVTINGIQQLFWADFEILVDLVFRGAGWQRVTPIGGPQKFIDIELLEPIMQDRYQVQVKSSASLSDFKEYADEFTPSLFRKFFFVVHTPTEDLKNYVPDPETGVELILPEHLARMVVNFGLVDWVLKKVK